MSVNVVVVGAGLIGCERISAIKKIEKLTNGGVSLLAVVDPNLDESKSAALEKKFEINITKDIDLVLNKKPEWVFICTPHDVAMSLIKKSFDAGANVLVEKPLGRSLKECQEIIKYKPDNCKLHVGFNYRFFAGVEQAIKDCKDKKFGKLISVNLTLGHGNSPGMEKSWKLDLDKCGGGCLIDPGVHLLDLILELSYGELKVDKVKSWSGFWNTGIEEEVHALMSDEFGTIFNMQVSLNKWRSSFKLEINGTEGYGVVEGRGRSYGPQSYKTGLRWGWKNDSGKSQSESENIIIQNDSCEDSFFKETMAVLDQGSYMTSPSNEIESKQVMALLDICYDNLK